MSEIEKREQKKISRRSFLAGASALGAIAGLGLFGCSQTSTADSTKSQAGSTEVITSTSKADSVEKQTSSTEAITAARWVPESVDKTYDTDILIVGCGGSGLACAVQSAENGADIIVIEKSNQPGGNANFVEGIFAINSKPQQEMGIEIKPADIIDAELNRGQYRQNGALWLDLCLKSADNIDWLLEQGCLFSGVIDDYHGGLFQTFHWWEEDKAGVGYVEPMVRRLSELGVKPHLETAAKSLIMENNKVAGVYAEGPEGNIQYNAKAVIFATGGFGGNPEMIAKQGWDTSSLVIIGSPNAAGDAYRMAMEVGGKDFLPDSCQSVLGHIKALPIVNMADPANPISGYFGIASGGPVLWVNEYADRYTNEDIRTQNMVLPSVTGKSNKANYCIFDQNIYETFYGITDEARSTFEESLEENEGESLFKADSIEELASKFDLDPKDLNSTIERYNELCAKGSDDDFAKPSDMMIPIEKGPFYIGKLGYSFFFTVGGIWTNKNRQVLNEDKDPIPGLYAIGNDGGMLYRNVYTINMPGTAFGNQVNSGREAANNALEYVNGI